MTARILDIIEETTADGEGLRTSIYFAGCKHYCKGCHNPQSWDMNGGYEVTLDYLMDIIKDDEFSDVTFSGGDPLYQCDAIRYWLWYLGVPPKIAFKRFKKKRNDKD